MSSNSTHVVAYSSPSLAARGQLAIGGTTGCLVLRGWGAGGEEPLTLALVFILDPFSSLFVKSYDSLLVSSPPPPAAPSRDAGLLGRPESP